MHKPLISLLLFTIATVLTPGPNNFMIMNAGLHHGLRKSLPHYLGICLGFPMMVFVLSLGLGELFMKYVLIRECLKIIGSIYMLYLAWQILRSHSKGYQQNLRRPLSFIQACLFQWINPKAWLMAIGVISIFNVSANTYINVLYIGITYLLVCIPGTGVWLLFGKTMRSILRHEQQRAVFNLIMAIALGASVLLIIFD